MNIYFKLTNQFNKGRLRAILSSGQAVVLHRLAIMSKDGDWIIREDPEALMHILTVLNSFGARYRFGAPLDSRWLAGGWSSHFEFMNEGIRIRTDFVSRPPRISTERLEKIWKEQQSREFPFVDLPDLAELKKTNREKDYAIIGDLSRRMEHIEERLRYSRSAREINEWYLQDPDKVTALTKERGIDPGSLRTVELLEMALDAERRRLIHQNERRLAGYATAAKEWSGCWKEVERKTAGLPLLEAHQILAGFAEKVLPKKIETGGA
jgi:hypothetical protein